MSFFSLNVFDPTFIKKIRTDLYYKFKIFKTFKLSYKFYQMCLT